MEKTVQTTEYIGVKEIMEEFGVVRSTAIEWIKGGNFSGAFKLPGRNGAWRIPANELHEYKERAMIGASGSADVKSCARVGCGMPVYGFIGDEYRCIDHGGDDDGLQSCPNCYSARAVAIRDEGELKFIRCMDGCEETTKIN